MSCSSTVSFFCKFCNERHREKNISIFAESRDIPPVDIRAAVAKQSETRGKKKRAQRTTSNVFAMFDQAQIQDFKEVFAMIDQNQDGFIDRDDLQETLRSLGKDPGAQELDQMVNEAPGPLNFTMFITLFEEKLTGTDPEDVIRNAFSCFDDFNVGAIDEEFLKDKMMTMGDRWSEDMIDELFHVAPIKDGRFDYMEFTRMIKHGNKDKEEEAQK
ncbi:myosin regulatory light chain-like isoform X2 [Liolophura sinensis]|uniref:myosin regulatory light chain-like isoform X2 n=1 Tax=Liolophura sinensis TaxID=3198878 RepID=UPI0031583FE4